MDITAEQIESLSTGRVLDALVASHVFGYMKVRTEKGWKNKGGQHGVFFVAFEEAQFYESPKGDEFADPVIMYRNIFHYSTQMDTAWTVVEAMKQHEADGYLNAYWFNFWQAGGSRLHELTQEEAATAICRAALMAICIPKVGLADAFAGLAELYKAADFSMLDSEE